ncbi:MAG: lipooligosaccharide transport system ATP-binding protein [Solirubrobacteraceae bacterium]|nr:lipooligosaccharide transport system ATP-binding protein [Solirubrobacteraceae bacterium]
MTGGAAVRARELRKAYGGIAAVDGIDFDVAAGECFGFLGPNGAGKTTTMKMIYGLASVGSGTLEVLGLDVARHRREVKARLGVVPQDDNLDRDLTVGENLLVHGGYFGLSRAEARRRRDELLDFASLAHRAGSGVRELSGGMRQRLLIARALVNRPELIVLDEPTTGLDPQARRAVWEVLGGLREQGVTFLLTTHYMEEAARLCDRLVVMDDGRIVDGGAPGELTVRHGQPDLEGVFLHLTGHGLDA